WKNAPVHFREAKGRLIGRDGEIAGADLGKSATEAISVDHRDGRLWKGRELLPTPAVRGASRTLHHGGILRAGTKGHLDGLTGADRLAGPGNHQDPGLLIDCKLVEHFVHLTVQLRTHGIALVGTVEGHEGNALFFGDFDGLIPICHWGSLAPLTIPDIHG